MEEATRDWRKLHNDELYHLCSLPNMIWAINCRRIRWIVHVARLGQKKDSYRVLMSEGKENCFEDIGMGGRVVLKSILTKLHMRMWTGLIWLKMRISGGLL